MTIDGPSTSISNISLYFEDNLAGFTGNILYGGQLDRCRLYFKSTDTNQSDLCDCQVTQVHSYSDNALEIFLNMSDITLNEDLVPIISSTSKEIKIKLSRKRLYRSKSVKYLGIKIDENLNWKQHLHDIAIKLNRANALLSIIRNYVNKLSLRTIYFAIFDSHINYDNPIWGQNLLL